MTKRGGSRGFFTVGIAEQCSAIYLNNNTADQIEQEGTGDGVVVCAKHQLIKEALSVGLKSSLKLPPDKEHLFSP